MSLLTKILQHIVPKLTGLLIPVLSVSFLLLLSCKSVSQDNQQQQVLPLLHFQKTTCFGSCPAYQATIATDGNVTFAGFAHVPSTDTLVFKLPPATLDSLKLVIDGLDYTTLQNLYPTQWSDMPSTLTTFYQDGKQVKRIKHTEGGPEKLRQFQEWLDKILLDMAEVAAKEKLPVK